MRLRLQIQQTPSDAACLERASGTKPIRDTNPQSSHNICGTCLVRLANSISHFLSSSFWYSPRQWCSKSWDMRKRLLGGLLCMHVWAGDVRVGVRLTPRHKGGKRGGDDAGWSRWMSRECEPRGGLMPLWELAYISSPIHESLADRVSDARACRVEVDMSKMTDTRRYPCPPSLLSFTKTTSATR